MKEYIIISLSFIILFSLFSCCTINNNKADSFEHTKSENSDTVFFSETHKYSIKEYHQRIEKMNPKFPKIMFRNINSPLNINEDLLNEHIEKINVRLNNIIPVLSELGHFKDSLILRNIRNKQQLSNCKFSCIPIYRMTPNIAQIEDFEKQQFVDYLTLDTVHHVVLVELENRIVDIFTYKNRYKMLDVGMDGAKISEIKFAKKHSKNVIGIVAPDYGGGSKIIYGFVNEARLKVVRSTGCIVKKDTEGKTISLENILRLEDDDFFFRSGDIATSWLESYYKKVEAYRKNPEEIWAKKRDPQFLIYSEK